MKREISQCCGIKQYAQTRVTANRADIIINQAVHTDREVTANGPDIIIKNKKRKHAH
jgi:hypothetical protein